MMRDSSKHMMVYLAVSTPTQQLIQFLAKRKMEKIESEDVQKVMNHSFVVKYL